MAKDLGRLLAISWAFPPLLTPRSLQVGRLLDAMAKRGWDITVLTVSPNSIGPSEQDAQILKQYSKSLRVIAIPDSKRRLLRISLGRFFHFLRPLPDPEGGWAKKAINAGKSLLRREKYSAILSFAQPWSSHLVALELHKITGLPWLAHFSDPWAENPYYADLSAEQLRRMQSLEATTIQSANILLFTNEQTSSSYANRYGVTVRQKSGVLPHSFDRHFFPSDHPPKDANQLRVAFTGNLYGLRNPENLLRALAKTDDPKRIRINIVGYVKDLQSYRSLAKDLGLESSINFAGRQSYRASLQMAAEADVLLVLDAHTQHASPFLPSKLIDYLMFRKPILGLTPKNGAAADLLHRLRAVQVEPSDIDAIVKALNRFLDAWDKGKLKVSPGFDQIAAEYEIGKVAQRFDSFLQKLLKSG